MNPAHSVLVLFSFSRLQFCPESQITSSFQHSKGIQHPGKTPFSFLHLLPCGPMLAGFCFYLLIILENKLAINSLLAVQPCQ